MSVRKCVGLTRLFCLLLLVGGAVAWASEIGVQDESRRRVIAPTASPWAEESDRDHALVRKSDGIFERHTGEGGMSARQRLKAVGTSRRVPGSNVAGATINVDVHASSAPNAFGSPSWAGYVVNALQALENNLSTNGNRATDPTGYEHAPSQIPPGEIAVSSFNSWRGVVSPAAPFNNEYGNRMHFGLHAYGDGATKFRLEDLTFSFHSDDPWDSLLFTGDFVGFNYSSTRYGIDWVDGIKGNGNDIVYTSGNGTTLVDEIVYVGVGNGWWPSGGTPQDDMDDFFAWVASYGPINVSCAYSVLGFTGSDSVTLSQQIVDDFGVHGWKSDDTRNPAGTDLVGTNYTHFGKPGQAPTGADDTAIASQIKFVNGPGGVPALEMTKTSTGGNSKCTLSKVDAGGFATNDWRPGFFANYRYYAGSSVEVAVLKLGIRSPLWGTSSGQSQNGFTAVRSGESAWDLILVDWRGTQPPWTVGAWDRFNTDANTQCWRIFRQGTNGFFNATPTPPGAQVGWSLNELYAMSDLGTPAHVARTGHTWSEMLFGTGAKVASIQFGVGSSTGSTTSYIDYLDTSLLNGGNRVDFVGALPTVTTIGAYPSQVPDEQEPQVNLGDAPLAYEPDSWKNSVIGKVNWHARYNADGNYLTALFPTQAATLTVNDIESILYWTNRPVGTAAGRDWLLFLYTRPPGDASWYGKRFVNNFDAHTEIGDWTHYSTDIDMTFRRNSGTPTGHMNLATLKATYGTELVEMFSVQTDSGWGGSGGFAGSIDGLTIILTDGSVGHVDFVRQPTITLEPNDECYASGETVTVNVWMNDVPESIVGGQFFLDYDDSKLTFVSANPGDSPFVLEVFEAVPGDGGAGTIDYAVSTLSGDPGVSGTKKLAVLTFTAATQICSETGLISWRSHAPPTRLSDASGGSVEPTLIGLDLSDTEDPTITTPASDSTVSCNLASNVAQLNAWLSSHGGAVATDNCGAVTWTHNYTGLSDLCGGTGAATVTFTATDECGNYSTTTATFTIQDTTAPAITCPAAATIECDDSTVPGLPYGTVTGGIMVYYNTAAPETPANQAYMKAQYSQTNTNGAAFQYSTVPLTGSGLTWALLWGQVGPPTQFGFDLVLEAPTASIPIPYPTAYNNTNNTIAGRAPAGLVRWEIDDYKPNVPVGPVNPTNQVINSQVRSVSGPNVNPLVDIEILSLNLVSTPPTATMTISGVLHSDGIHHWYTPATPDSPMSLYNLNGDFYFSGTLVYDSTLDVTAGGAYYSGTIQISANSASTGLGYALATDACDLFPVVSYTDNLAGLTGCDGTGTIVRTWSATDACGNNSTCNQTITVVDTTPPVLSSCPANITVPADAGGCDAVVTYTPPTATDNCDSSAPVVCSPASGSIFGPGTTPVTCTATDDCSNSSQCMFNVTLTAFNELDVTVQLSPTVVAGPFDRCITFELWDCPGVVPTHTANAVMTFSGGLATGTINVACGNYECITARDRRHTLRRKDEAFGITGDHYTADFTGNPGSGGDWLISGNLNNDAFVDILDFGVFTSQWLVNYGSGNTTCSTAAPHADLNGDGIVNNAEFTFIQINFLKGNEANCCGAPGIGPGEGEAFAIQQISVDELWEHGLGELASGDLNADGLLDMLDIEAFALGARPVAAPVPAPIELAPTMDELEQR